MIAVVMHAPYSDAGLPIANTGNALLKYLSSINRDYIQLIHPLQGTAASFLTIAVDGKSTRTQINLLKFSNLLFKSIVEIVSTIIILSKRNDVNLYIGIDPLNTLPGLVLKLLGKTSKTVFYTADYAKSRFDNRVLNTIYHLLDRLACQYSDEVWNVSSRIVDVRKKMRIPENKLFFVPNSPFKNWGMRSNTIVKNRFEMLVVTTLLDSIHFENLFKAISLVKVKFLKIHLNVVGVKRTNKKITELLSNLNIQDNITFIPFMEYDQLQLLIRKVGVGIALYSNTYPWTYYCDSMKARDYLAAGCPVLISNFVSTADDINNFRAGYSVDSNSYTEITHVIEKTLTLSDKEYERMSNNALKLAKANDISKILNKRIPKQ